MRFRELAAVAGIATLVLTGCGGGDDGDSDDTVATVSAADKAKLELVSDQLSLAAEADSGARLCSFLQPSLINKALGSKAKCARKAGRALAREGTFENLEIDSILRTDRGATVTYTKVPPGQVDFVKEGGAWYVDLSSSIGAGQK